MLLHVLLTLAATAWGQAVSVDRPTIPSASITTEGGPGAAWVNPANMAYDTDPRYGVFLTQELRTGATAFAATGGLGGMALGVHNLSVPSEGSDWSVAYGTSLRLPERVAVGLNVNWHLVDGGANFVAYDAGLSWRPLPWIGLGAVAWNIGNPDPAGRVMARSGFGLALRPLGDFAMLGADYVRLFDPDDPEQLVRVTARFRPVEGLYLRGSWDTGQWFGAGVEFYFGGHGGGVHVAGEQLGDGVTAWLGTDEPGETLIRSGRRVPVLVLDRPPPYSPRGGLLIEPERSWLETLELLRRVEDDPGVRGVVLSMGVHSMSWARWEELRGRIRALEDRGKPCVAYLRNPSTGAYFAATAASRVLLHPGGTLELVGVRAELVHLRGMLDRVGIEPDYVRRSEYKSAIETATHTEPSGPAVEQLDALLDDLHGELVEAIGTGRERSEQEVLAWVDGGPWTATEALAAGMVDGLVYPDEVSGYVEELHGGPVRAARLEKVREPRSGWESPAQILVLYVEGVLVQGVSSPDGLLGPRTSGARTLVEALREAREDAQVRAVVIRVDSPGGSAFAADEVWRGVDQVKQAGKPVVVSMGGTAASGGYYVAAGADAIWAEPSTVTGSIGVYSGKMSFDSLFDRVGVSTTTLVRGRNADLWSPHPWDEVQRARVEALVDETYRQFKDKVADGRGLSPEEVEEVARGRIWSGRAAAEVELVDELGGLQDAIADARRRAGIPAHREVSLVTMSSSGPLAEVLGPSAVRAIAGLAGARRPGALAEELAPLALPEAYNPLLLWALHSDELVWMMAPWSLEAR